MQDNTPQRVILITEVQDRTDPTTEGFPIRDMLKGLYPLISPSPSVIALSVAWCLSSRGGFFFVFFIFLFAFYFFQ